MTRRLLRLALCVLVLGGCDRGGVDGERDAGLGDRDAGLGDRDAGLGDRDAALDGGAAPAGNTPGTYDETLTVGEQRREVIVYVPDGARDVRAPVVIMLHGTAQDGQQFYEISGWREKADAEGMIVLFPSALTHCFFEDENDDGDFDDSGERAVTSRWAQGNLGDPTHTPLCTPEDIAALAPAQQAAADHPLADDVAFFDAMLAMLAADYAVDDRATYVTGFSNGGQMAARLAVERSDRIAAAHAAAGTLAADGVASRPISMIFSVGSEDDRFTTPAGVAELPLAEDELAALPIFQAIVSAFLTATQLDPTYTYERLTVGPEEVARLRFTTSTVGASNRFEAFVVGGLAHQYPNGTNHVVSAPDVLWTFFEPQRLP